MMERILEFKDLYRPLGNKSSFLRESGYVNDGQILAIKGPSGSGKSTLLRMLARLITAQSGEVYWRGTDWHFINPGTWRRSIHYVSQKPVMLNGTVEDNLLIPFSLGIVKDKILFSQQDCDKYMEVLDLSPELLGQNAHTLSGGEASRVALLRALIIDPEVLLLDEPTAYLDDDIRLKVIHLVSRWVKEKTGRAIIIVSHNDGDLSSLEGISVLEIGRRKEAQLS